MNRHDLIEQARNALMRCAGAGMRDDAREAMNRRVEQFFADHVSRLDKAEILEHMATPMKGLRWFSTYLCRHFRERCECGPVSGDAETCRMT